MDAGRDGGGVAVALAVHPHDAGVLVVVEVDVEVADGVALVGAALHHHGRRRNALHQRTVAPGKSINNQ